MRARCAFDRSTLGVHIQGATAERGGAVGSRHPGARTGSDGSDEAICLPKFVSQEVPYTVMLVANPGRILWDPDGILAPQWTRTNIERGVGAVGTRIPLDPSEIPLN